MKTIKFNPKETGWVRIDGDVKTIVAHFNNGEKETMNIIDFVIMDRSWYNKIVQIDCYKEGEEIK